MPRLFRNVLAGAFLAGSITVGLGTMGCSSDVNSSGKITPAAGGAGGAAAGAGGGQAGAGAGTAGAGGRAARQGGHAGGGAGAGGGAAGKSGSAGAGGGSGGQCRRRRWRRLVLSEIERSAAANRRLTDLVRARTAVSRPTGRGGYRDSPHDIFTLVTCGERGP